MKLFLVLCFIIIIITIYVMRSCIIDNSMLKYPEFAAGTAQESKIPAVIWTFWDGDVPYFVVKCIMTWAQKNPNYTINILNTNTIAHFLPEVDFEHLKHVENQPARLSDYVRLNILKKYGGIWIDASSICNTTLDWVHGIQNAYDVEFVGYYLDGFTEPHMVKDQPVVESWFLACVPGSRFIADWCDEFMRMDSFDTIQEYIDDLTHKGVSFQRIQYIDYLTIHLSAQCVLQQGKKDYKIYVIKAEDGPLKWLSDYQWNIEDSVKILFESGALSQPLMKLRGCDRVVINDNYKAIEHTLFA